MSDREREREGVWGSFQHASTALTHRRMTTHGKTHIQRRTLLPTLPIDESLLNFLVIRIGTQCSWLDSRLRRVMPGVSGSRPSRKQRTICSASGANQDSR